MNHVVAVIDIGMTNKKISIYDQALKLLASVKKVFKPIIIDKIEAHDLASIEAWFIEQLAIFSAKYDISSIAVSTHGATVVCCDEAGNPVFPCFYYTHEPGDAFHNSFFEKMGEPEKLQYITGTPNFSALINPAKALFFLKQKFTDFDTKTKLVLSYPQYWGFRFTGKAGAEGTYTGCHTYLWDWEKNTYSSVAHALSVAAKLPKTLHNSWDVLGNITHDFAKKTGLKPDTIVTMGIHDSNASILPYLIKHSQSDFVLNSTGSWCVIMHPVDNFGFKPDDIGKMVFFNRSAYNKPIKTALFTGGLEYNAWIKAIEAWAKKTVDIDHCDFSIYRQLFLDKNLFVLPEIIKGSGQFTQSSARIIYKNNVYSFGYFSNSSCNCNIDCSTDMLVAALNVSLVIQSLVALERAGLKSGVKVYTEGGFRNNKAYNILLQAALPNNDIYISDMSEATSTGAAITAIAALKALQPDDMENCFNIEEIKVEMPAQLDGINAYKTAWLNKISST